jgi:hypothetical protein
MKSDFLTVLLDRALERTAVIELRRSSRFEAPADQPRTEVNSLEQSQQTSERYQPSPIRDPFEARGRVLYPLAVRDERFERDEARPGSHTFRPDDESSERTDAPAEVVARDHSLFMLGNQGRIPAPDVEPTRSQRPLAEALSPAAGSPRELNPPEPESPIERRTVIEREIIKASREIRINEVREVVLAPPSDNSPSPAAKIEPPEPTAPVTNRHNATRGTSRIANWPAISPIMPPMSQHASRRSIQRMQREPESEPLVQVTIGRIEIRTTQASTVTRATRQAGPRLKLEDYLRSRGESG